MNRTEDFPHISTPRPRRFAAAALAAGLLLLTTACASTPTARAGTPLPDLVGTRLDLAKSQAQKAGFPSVDSVDARDRARKRQQFKDRNWVVCTQTPAAGTPQDGRVRIVLGVVKGGESCPAQSGDALVPVAPTP